MRFIFTPDSKMKSPTKICVFINPIAGKQSSVAIQGKLKEIFKKPGIDSSYYFTVADKGVGDIVELELKKGVQDFLVVGGDGTVNMVAIHLLGNRANLGIVPAGSGNGLARHLKIPTSLSKLPGFIRSHKILKMDYGLLNELPFFCTAGLGFDAKVAHSFTKQKKRGFTNYLRVMLKDFAEFKSKTIKIDFHDKSISFPSFSTTFANSAQFGNNAYISPDASVQDGFLDMCMITAFPKIKAILMGQLLMSGSINSSSYYEMVRIKEALVIRDQPGWIHIDGEPLMMPEKLVVKVIPSGLNVWVSEEYFSRKTGH